MPKEDRSPSPKRRHGSHSPKGKHHSPKRHGNPHHHQNHGSSNSAACCLPCCKSSTCTIV